MAVDDHAINALKTWYEIEYERLKKEWKSGMYFKVRNCPNFYTTLTYREALNVLIHGPQYVDETQLKRLIEEDLEIEQLQEKNKRTR